MKFLSLLLVILFAVPAYSKDKSIDLLQNRILKIEEKLNKSESKSKAYFSKGNGLSIKSYDGKYKFALKGRMMYDIGGLLNYKLDDSDVSMDNGFGSEFRRLRFSLKSEVGNGWGFAFQPDFADGGDDSADRKVIVKDALMYKKIKNVGKFTFGNQKAAAGLYENTSSNNLMFMERPMHNEVMNLGHRSGIGYDTSGAFGKYFHLKTTLFSGGESAIEQNLSDGESGNETYGASVATHYNIKGYGGSLLTGFHYGYWNVSNINGALDTPNGARAQGIHTLKDKVVDFGNMSNLESLSFYGPQFSLIYKDFLLQGEYQRGAWGLSKTTGGVVHDDLTFHGGSIGAVYQFLGNGKFKHSGKKGALGGFKCKRHCTMAKYQYEFIDAVDQPTNSHYNENIGGSGQAHTFGINHYFNPNVRVMAEYAHGDYSNDNSQGGASSKMNSIQLRLHLKY